MAFLLKLLGSLPLPFLHLLSVLPLPFLHLLGTLVGNLRWWFPSKRKRVTLCNIAACLPELSPVEQRSLARRAYMHEAMTLLESPRLRFGPSKRVAWVVSVAALSWLTRR